jgi:hypothetical protein
MRGSWKPVWLLPAVVLSAAATSASAQVVNEWEQRIENAKKKAVDYLFSQQEMKLRLVMGADGKDQEDIDAEWKDVVIVKGTRSVKVKGKVYDNVYAVLPPGWFKPDPPGHGNQVGGPTCLVVAALLAAGVNPMLDKRMAKAVECVVNMHTPVAIAGKNREEELLPGLIGTYAIGLRANALEYALTFYRTGENNIAVRKALQHDGLQLQDGYTKTGGYSYVPVKGNAGGGWDLSCTQYGILGLWAAARANIELSDKTWRHFNQFLLDIQTRDGGWPYGNNGQATTTMTSAGIASLFVMLDLVHTRTRGANKPDISPFSNDPLLLRTVQGLERGMEYWGKVYAPGGGYLNYGAERVGVASGYKYYGKHDWFKEGATALMARQTPGGSWGNILETSWNLLFIVYGNAPILINKLQYASKDGKTDWQWHNYPRDAANVALWYGKTYESLVNWQIISLDPAKEEDLMDAPITYICGYKEQDFKDEEVDILRRYVEKGGTLLFVAAGGQPAFVKSVIKLGTQLYPADKYPEYQFTAVPKDHPIYTYGAGKAGDPDFQQLSKLRMHHMTNGHRSFAFIVTEDINHMWHGNKFNTRRYAFNLIANLRNYATERAPKMHPKIRPLITAGEPKYAGAARGPIKLGVVAYTSGGKIKMQKTAGLTAEVDVETKSDWASAPMTWRIYNEWFRHVTGHDIQEVRGVQLTDPELKKYDVLHMTGHYAFTLTAEEQTALRNYVLAGGSVIVDPTGGVNNDFYVSALAVFRKLFPDKVENLSRSSPVVSGKGAAGRDVTDASFSRGVRLARPDLKSAAEVLKAVTIDDRPAVLLSPYDLSLGIAGQVCWGRLGFNTQSARDLVANYLVLIKSGRQVAAAGAN